MSVHPDYLGKFAYRLGFAFVDELHPLEGLCERPQNRSLRKLLVDLELRGPCARFAVSFADDLLAARNLPEGDWHFHEEASVRLDAHVRVRLGVLGEVVGFDQLALRRLDRNVHVHFEEVLMDVHLPQEEAVDRAPFSRWEVLPKGVPPAPGNDLFRRV